MAEQKKPRQKKTLTLEEAAVYTGMTEAELMQSRGRGMQPGIAGFKKDGVLVWNRTDLPKASAPEEDG